jgi:ribosome-binding protein aMBF1 (putative translation factor)
MKRVDGQANPAKSIKAKPAEPAHLEHEELGTDISRAVTQQRKRRRWSQRHLAKRARLSVATIREVENGFGQRLKLSSGLRLFRLLGIRVKFVLMSQT